MDSDSLPRDYRACSQCGALAEPKVTVLNSGVHYAEMRCPECNKFFGFMPKPKNEGKRPNNKHSAKSLDIDYCQMCMRKVDRLGSHGSLEVHHVIEISNGGEDTPNNIWVICTSCHRLIHHQRTYLNNHFKGVYTIENLESDMEFDRVPKNVKARLRNILNYSRGTRNA